MDRLDHPSPQHFHSNPSNPSPPRRLPQKEHLDPPPHPSKHLQTNRAAPSPPRRLRQKGHSDPPPQHFNAPTASPPRHLPQKDLVDPPTDQYHYALIPPRKYGPKKPPSNESSSPGRYQYDYMNSPPPSREHDHMKPPSNDPPSPMPLSHPRAPQYDRLINPPLHFNSSPSPSPSPPRSRSHKFEHLNVPPSTTRPRDPPRYDNSIASPRRNQYDNNSNSYPYHPPNQLNPIPLPSLDHYHEKDDDDDDDGDDNRDAPVYDLSPS